MVADLEKKDMEKRIQSTGQTMEEYRAVKNEIYSAPSAQSSPSLQPSWRDVLDQLVHPQDPISPLDQKTNASIDENLSDKMVDKKDYRPQFEKEAHSFIDQYNAYKKAESEGRLTEQDTLTLKQKAVALSQNENAIWYLEVRNPEMGQVIQRLAKDHNRSQTLNRDTGLSR
ncbi:MAG: hypothetical protein K0M45_06260 [Candidatus Paracaedibacteraceae bacterium]|nr:hypothetical protein [Candidatus Paracaedibacteraceae bacterium]